jgi:hypothetical protein
MDGSVCKLLLVDSGQVANKVLPFFLFHFMSCATSLPPRKASQFCSNRSQILDRSIIYAFAESVLKSLSGRGTSACCSYWKLYMNLQPNLMRRIDCWIDRSRAEDREHTPENESMRRWEELTVESIDLEQKTHLRMRWAGASRPEGGGGTVCVTARGCRVRRFHGRSRHRRPAVRRLETSLPFPSPTHDRRLGRTHLRRGIAGLGGGPTCRRHRIAQGCRATTWKNYRTNRWS